MWAIKVLNGPTAGKSILLRSGRNTIGRAPECTVSIPENGISKEHAEIEVVGSRMTIKDLQSRNGVFLNGTKIQQKSLKVGDKILIHNIVFEIVTYQEKKPAPQIPKAVVPAQMMARNPHLPAQTYPQSHQVYQQRSYVPNPGQMGNRPASAKPATIWEKLADYLDTVFLPGVYHLTTIFEYKIVFGILLGVFTLSLTALSLIPMIAITRESIDSESRRRALTIARNLANLNQAAVLSGNQTAITVNFAEAEEGVSDAYIINDGDGTVIAPAEEVGSIPEIPLIEKARISKQEMSEKTGINTLVVSVPISMFSPESGQYVAKAHAVISYDMGTLALDDNRVLALFIQTLFIATIIGGIIYYLMYKLLEYPLVELSRDVESALRDKKESVQFKLNFPVLTNFIEKLNTALSRAALASDDSNKLSINRDIEADNIIKLVGYSGLVVKPDLTIIATNEAFQMMMNVADSALRNQPVTLIPDQALQKNIIDLIEKCTKDFGSLASNELEFGGDPYQISSQAILNEKGPEYFVITIMQMGGHG